MAVSAGEVGGAESRQRFNRGGWPNVSSNKSVPYSPDAEGAVLGAIMLDNSCINEVMELLKPDDFYNKSNKKIFEVMIELDKQSSALDIITVSERIRLSGEELKEVGGTSHITYLAEKVPTSSNVSYYAGIVRDASLLRQIIKIADEILFRVKEGVNHEVLLDDADSKLMEIALKKFRPAFCHPPELVARALKHMEEAEKRQRIITGLSTGFRKIDELTSGLQPSDFIVVAARPSLGKTSFCLNIAEHVGTELGKTVAIFSLEMTEMQLMQRILSMMTNVSFSDIRSGRLKDKDEKKISEVSDKFGSSFILIDDTAAQTAFEIRAKCRRLKKTQGLDLVIVDYLQLMRGDMRIESREREIAQISSSLKALAKELDVPVIAVSQLSRQTETRSDRRPQLSDLRESGAIEQDADVVMLIHRPDFYAKDDDDKDSAAEVIIAKQRNGPLGACKLAFLENIGVPGFAELADEYDGYGGQ